MSDKLDVEKLYKLLAELYGKANGLKVTYSVKKKKPTKKE